MATILVVDDDVNIVELLNFLLTREGHSVTVAHDGKEGLTTAKGQRFDLIILDVMMPEMDGFMVSGELFKSPETRNTPVLILTAKGASRGILELVPNVRLYMDKPFDKDELLKNVRKILPTPPQAA